MPCGDGEQNGEQRGGNERHAGEQRKPQPDLCRSALTHRQEIALRLHEGRELGDDVVHQGFAFAGLHDGERRVPVALFGEVDRALDAVEPRLDQRLQPIQAGLLVWIVGSQLTQACQQLGHAGERAVEALEIVVVSGDEEAALAVFRGLDLAQQGLGRALHLEGVVDELVGLPAAGKHQRDRDGRDHHQAEAYRHDDPGVLYQAAGF